MVLEDVDSQPDAVRSVTPMSEIRRHKGMLLSEFNQQYPDWEWSERRRRNRLMYDEEGRAWVPMVEPESRPGLRIRRAWFHSQRLKRRWLEHSARRAMERGSGLANLSISMSWISRRGHSGMTSSSALPHPFGRRGERLRLRDLAPAPKRECAKDACAKWRTRSVRAGHDSPTTGWRP